MTERKQRLLEFLMIILVVWVISALGMFTVGVVQEFLFQIRYYDTIMTQLETEEDQEFAQIQIELNSEENEWFEFFLAVDETTTGRIMKHVAWCLAVLCNILVQLCLVTGAGCGFFFLIMRYIINHMDKRRKK